jgi:hypothetical protein
MPDVREGNAHRRIERRLLRHLRLWEKRVRVHFGATAPRTIRKPWLDEPFPTTTPNRVLRPESYAWGLIQLAPLGELSLPPRP